ncbi:hypothetical protein TrVFT333_001623 [Trichoderma virens FT-333]|nr:hypothetical protein TrVFT333_001623 [Trichoderma virens FT-333]
MAKLSANCRWQRKQVSDEVMIWHGGPAAQLGPSFSPWDEAKNQTDPTRPDLACEPVRRDSRGKGPAPGHPTILRPLRLAGVPRLCTLSRAQPSLASRSCGWIVQLGQAFLGSSPGRIVEPRQLTNSPAYGV